MIYYSRQNPIDLCPVNWAFDDSDGRFYNWKNQPSDEAVLIPPRKVPNQIYIEDLQATEIVLDGRIINAYTGEVLTGILNIFSIPTELTGIIYMLVIDVSLIAPHLKFYFELDVIFDGTRTNSFRSSCFIVQVEDDDKLLRIDYGNTINNRFVSGMLFFEGTYYQRYLYTKKYDTEIEINDDEQSNDFEGNMVLVDKTHSETDVFIIVEMPKKFFMGLVSISENDIIMVNGRKANISLEKVTVSKIGSFEIPFVNAFLRVIYADNDGLLDVQNQTEADYLLINDTDYLLINELNRLKTR